MLSWSIKKPPGEGGTPGGLGIRGMEVNRLLPTSYETSVLRDS